MHEGIRMLHKKETLFTNQSADNSPDKEESLF
jgi:hypothetical protein